MDSFYKIISTASGFRPSYGTLLIVAFVILALASTFRQGKGGVLRNIISLYMTIAVNNFLPFLNLEVKGFRIEGSPTLKIALFVVIFLLISFLLSRSSLDALDTSRSTLLNTLILSFLGSGLLLSTVSVMLPSEIKNELTGIAHLLFVNEIARFLWVLSPIIFIVLIG